MSASLSRASDRSRLASRSRFAGAICALGLFGCITTDIRVGEASYAPRIPPNLVQPKPDRVVVVSSLTDPLQTFQVTQFEDPNVSDTLYIRWFVNYDRNSDIRRQINRAPVPNSTSPDIRVGDTFELRGDMLRDNPGAGPHIVQAVVCDRPFDDSATAAERNRTCAPPDARIAMITWTVQLAATSTKPSPQRHPPPEVSDVR